MIFEKTDFELIFDWLTERTERDEKKRNYEQTGIRTVMVNFDGRGI